MPRRLRAGDNRRRQRMFARLFERRRQAQQPRSSVSRRPRRRASAGLPSVSVPVLSTTSVSTCSRRLERFGVA